MNGTFIAGIDIGGTNTKIGLLDTEGNIIHRLEQPTRVELGEDGVIQRVSALIEELLREASVCKHQLLGVGIGVPGPVDHKNGVVYHAFNLHWKKTPLREKLANASGLPVFVENDANAAALGEMWRGAGAGSSDLIMVTLGTGVGGGIIVNGEVIHGINGIGGEIGHISLEPAHGPLCKCGKRGCLETYASATALVRAGRERAINGSSKRLAELLGERNELTAKDVLDAAKSGDAAATEAVDQAAYYLGLAFSHLIHLLNPAKIVVGGGISAAGVFFLGRVREVCKQFVPFPQAMQSCEIVPARLGNDAGIVGAAWLVRAQKGRNVTP